MYPRLTLARDLLSSNGIIFISIDDNEQANLKLLCDYIFGEENCLGTIIWKNATDNNPTNIACEHEYILCYAQNKNCSKRFNFFKSICEKCINSSHNLYHLDVTNLERPAF